MAATIAAASFNDMVLLLIDGVRAPVWRALPRPYRTSRCSFGHALVGKLQASSTIPLLGL